MDMTNTLKGSYFSQILPKGWDIEKIKECGTDIIYRLGSSMEQGDFRFYNEPPKDYAKWARICEHIIRHYTEGWADGFNYDIKYWEIWGEPDSPSLWNGSMDEYFELYCVTAKYLKEKFPKER